MQTVLNTVVLALLASVCSTILGTIGAIGTFYSGRKVKGTLNALTQIPVINAEIVTAISIALVCSMFAFGRTYASLLIGHIVLCFPFVYLSVLPKLKQLDGNLYEAALDLGASSTIILSRPSPVRRRSTRFPLTFSTLTRKAEKARPFRR